MNSMRGLLHKTSLQTARDRFEELRQTEQLAGKKRSLSSDGSKAPDDPTPSAPSHVHVKFQRTVTLQGRPNQLQASTIVGIRSSEDVPSEYSQRLQLAATPTATRDPELDLAHPRYGLPTRLVENFASLGIKQIYPWQKNCLKGPGLLEGTKNLVYCAPTGGGKSLVADVLMLRKVLEEKGNKALLILPYVALVQEKVRWMRRVVEGLGYPFDMKKDDKDRIWRRRADENSVRVVGFFGGGRVRATWHDFDIGVCTLEKANNLINQAVEDCCVQSLKSVVLDELHMVDDDHRGYLLELIAAKVLSLDQAIQIVGMSATLPNKDLLARWLHAHSYETLYRPVPIEEHLVYNGDIYALGTTRNLIKTTTELTSHRPSQRPPKPLRHITPSTHKELKDAVLNAVVALAHETALTGFGVLVFAGSRSTCEADARWISRVMPGPGELLPRVADRRLDLLNDLRSLSTGLDPVLEQTIIYGVAFHHAGLTSEERDLIAEAYDAGTLLICVATCSLATGINLPARRVILHHARMGRDFVGPSMLRQMRGRAGRQGKAPMGETFLCCRQEDLEQVVELMHAELPEVSSCLNTENRRIQRAILEVISIRLATSLSSLQDYFSNSLISHSQTPEFVSQNLDSSLDELESMGFVEKDELEQYSTTLLGRAIVASAIDPYDGLFIHKELSRALKAFVMDGEMHILYMFTPVQGFSAEVNWQVFRNQVEALDESGLRVLGFLGIKPTVIMKLAQGATLSESTEEEREQARIYRRFYFALQLRDLCNEVPIHVVARKYDMPRGSVQTLSQTCQGFAAGVVKFCETMGWGVMAVALDHFADRLIAGARTELLALTKVTFIKSRTARVFWENGFRSVASLANADAQDLVPILYQAQPNKIRVKGKDSEKYEEKLLAKAQVIAASANRLWQIEVQAAVDEQ